MNDLIALKVMGREPTRAEQPNVLQDYANTSSAGSIIAFLEPLRRSAQRQPRVICSFGGVIRRGAWWCGSGETAVRPKAKEPPAHHDR